jgi:hypothetical protein
MTGPLPITAEGGQSLPGNGQQVAVPSGQSVTLQEVLWNVPGPDGLTARFRFLAPQIARNGGTVSFETASADMAWLCQNFAIDRISTLGPAPQQVIISLADRDIPFGQTDEEATQFFDAYRIEDGKCVWEAF